MQSKGKEERKFSLINGLLKAGWLRRIVPQSLKMFLFRLLPARARHVYGQRWLEVTSLYPGLPESDTSGRVDVTVGILKGFGTSHLPYVAACRDLGVPYKVVDIADADWQQAVEESGCDAFAVWPEKNSTVRRQFYDERLRFIAEDMGKVLYPNHKALWVYESKRRMAYWFERHGVPHPRTWVFYTQDRALEFVRGTELPIITKTDLGSGATGVQVHRKRATLVRWVKRLFGRGVLRPRADPRDREWGCVLFQEYIPDVREWRMIRIGESYFGYEKMKAGEFHSGSHERTYGRPPDRLLDFVHQISEKAGTLSLDVDVLVCEDGRLLALEFQPVFGLSQPYQTCVVDAKPGRMVRSENGVWRFEPGDFCQNHMCNQRVAAILGVLGVTIPDHGQMRG
jgi:hypothetical protein